MKCPKCKTINDEKLTKCTKCSAKLQSTKQDAKNSKSFDLKTFLVFDKDEILYFIISIFLSPLGIIFAVLNYKSNFNRTLMCIYGSVIGVVIFILFNTLFKDLFLYF